MYVSPFWLGVAATIIAEVAIIIIACFVTGLKEGKNNEQN